MTRGYRLTAPEQRHVRIAIRYLRTRCGTLETLAKSLCVQDDSLRKILRGARGVTPELAFRISRFARVTMDDLLSGHLVPAGTCPHCGRAPDEDMKRTARSTALTSRRD